MRAAPLHLMMEKSAIDHGWFLTNLGYPFGQTSTTSPTASTTSTSRTQVLGWVFAIRSAVNVFC